MKVCTKCRSELDEAMFHKDSNRKDGLACWCKPCVRINSKNHYKNQCPKKRLEAKRAWQDKNREHVNKYNEQWRKDNPHKHAARQRKRAASKLFATPPWLTKDQEQEMQSLYALCKKFEALFKVNYHVDHIVPLKGKNVCGLHVPWNLQILEEKFNLRKSNKEISYVDIR